MKCKDHIEFLAAYLDGSLPEDLRAEFEDHLNRCPPCRDYLRTYKDTIRLSQAAGSCQLSPTPIPDDLVRAILHSRKSQGGT